MDKGGRAKWEYCKLISGPDLHIDVANDLGCKGWEMVTPAPTIVRGETVNSITWFKRRIRNG